MNHKAQKYTYTYMHTEKAEIFTKFERCFHEKLQTLQSSMFVIIVYVNVFQLLTHGLIGTNTIFQRGPWVVPKNYFFTHVIQQPRCKKLPQEPSPPWRFWKSTSQKGLQRWSNPTLEGKGGKGERDKERGRKGGVKEGELRGSKHSNLEILTERKAA